MLQSHKRSLRMSSNRLVRLLSSLLFAMTMTMTILVFQFQIQQMLPRVSGFGPAVFTSTTRTRARCSVSNTASCFSNSNLFFKATTTTTTNTLLYAKKDVKKKNTSTSSPSSASASSSSSSSSHYASSAAAAAASAADFASHDSSSSNDGISMVKKPSFPVILWRFTRPHTIIGSALAIPALHLLAAPSLQAACAMKTLHAMLYAMIPALLMNLYITGLNQITDVEIDKINKPYLPMAAGLLSRPTAIVTVIVALISSLYLGQAHTLLSTPGLNVALWGSAILGTLYSLPPFRLKRFHVLAAFCIVAVRGAIINAAFFAHAMAAAYSTTSTTTAAAAAAATTTTATATTTVMHCLQNYKACAYSSAFFAIFGLVIALMKDVPDIVGDRMANILTVPVRIGPRRVLFMMRWLLTSLFWTVSAMFANMTLNAAASTSYGLMTCRIITSTASLAAGWSVQRQARNVNPEDSGQVYKYYMHLWKLFYLSYLVLPFCR